MGNTVFIDLYFREEEGAFEEGGAGARDRQPGDPNTGLSSQV
jgi:hypothetical protein